MRQTVGQLFRYGVVGLLSNALAYMLYLALTAAGMGPKLAMTLLFALGVIQTFIFNKRWSFRHSGADGPALVRYCAAYALVYPANLLLMTFLVDRLGWSHRWVMGGLVVFMAMFFFMLQKLWIFRSNSAAELSIERE